MISKFAFGPVKVTGPSEKRAPGVLERLGNKAKVNLPWTGQLFFAFKIPEIYWEYSTKRVLTMEFCEGGKVDDLPYMQSFKISSDEASRNLKILKLFSCLDLVFGNVSCKSTIYTWLCLVCSTGPQINFTND